MGSRWRHRRLRQRDPLRGGAAGGGGSASSSGSTRSALDGARNYTSRAAEDIHSSVVREASGRRRAQRSSFRLATETDQATVTTKVITNNNRTKAMTVQYWEVLRHFRIQSEVEGCSLVCFVPLDLVRFLPAFARVNLDPADVDTRLELLGRYSRLAGHADYIRAWLPARHREGLRLLEEFVANPRATPDLGGPAATTVATSLLATVLPFEDLWAKRAHPPGHHDWAGPPGRYRPSAADPQERARQGVHVPR